MPRRMPLPRATGAHQRAVDVENTNRVEASRRRTHGINVAFVLLDCCPRDAMNSSTASSFSPARLATFKSLFMVDSSSSCSSRNQLRKFSVMWSPCRWLISTGVDLVGLSSPNRAKAGPPPRRFHIARRCVDGRISSFPLNATMWLMNRSAWSRSSSACALKNAASSRGLPRRNESRSRGTEDRHQTPSRFAY